MKKNTPAYLSAGLIMITVISIAYGLSSARKLRAARAEANQLRLQINELREKKTTPLRSSRPAPALKATASIDTNAAAALQAELATLRAQLAEAQANRPPNREERESREERMARMKAEDPEGYAEMLKQREERRNQMRYHLAERTANFMELDTTYMTEGEMENHEELLLKMGQIWELTEQLQDPEQQMSRETMRELFQLTREAQPLMDAERITMFNQLANDLGMEGEDATAFSGYVEEIIETTTIQMPRGGGRGGPGGGR